jgi:hypothetical protein
MSAIVCDDTHLLLSTQSMIIFVVDTSGWHIALTRSTWKTPTAMFVGLRRRSSSGGTKLRLRREFPVLLLILTLLLPLLVLLLQQLLQLLLLLLLS